MTRSGSTTHPPPRTLDPAAESEWRRLRRHLEWSVEHWLGFLFVTSPAVAGVFRDRLAAVLRQRARPLTVLHPATPAALEAAILDLLRPAGEKSGCVWLEGLGSSRSAGQRAEWSAAWGRLLLRLNEVRDRLRRTLPGAGVLLVARPEVKELARTAAPDLWSARSLVLEPGAGTGLPRTESRTPGRPSAEVFALGDPETPAREVRESAPADYGTGRTEEATLLEALRRGEGLLQLERPAEALADALRAADLAARVEATGRRAEALWLATRAAVADGDRVAAAEYLDAALRQMEPTAERRHLEWFDLRGEIALESADLTRALEVYETMLRLARRLLREYGDSPERLRDLSVSLDKVGSLRHTDGEIDRAAEAYREALEVLRQVAVAYGSTPSRKREIRHIETLLAETRQSPAVTT